MSKKLTILFLHFFLFQTILSFGQVTETKSWCNLTCEYTAEDKLNAELLHLRMNNDSIKQHKVAKDIKSIPIRLGIVQHNTVMSELSEEVVRKMIFNLNKTFENVKFKFYLEKIDLIISELKLEDLSRNRYDIYNKLSKENDEKDMITIYVLDHKNDFCVESNGSLSCGRTGGFSYILSERANNVVVSRFDLEDPKIVAHELGHFFGLYHTFEEHLFGKDRFVESECRTTGDRICDTPPDPGTFFEIYVNYSKCEMIGFEDEHGNEYKPLLENIMSYFKPCYLKEYSFTPQQVEIMRMASELDFRKKLFR